jgi:hypothetical protein
MARNINAGKILGPSPQTVERMDEVHRLHKGGMTVTEACKQAGINGTTYYRWNPPKGKKVGKRLNAGIKPMDSVEVPLPVETPKRMAVIFGTIEQILSVIRGM